MSFDFIALQGQLHFRTKGNHGCSLKVEVRRTDESERYSLVGWKITDAAWRGIGDFRAFDLRP